MKTDFHDPLISVLDYHQLFMAIKRVFMHHEIIFIKILMGFNEAIKLRKCNIHGPEKRFMGFYKYFMGFL